MRNFSRKRKKRKFIFITCTASRIYILCTDPYIFFAKNTDQKHNLVVFMFIPYKMDPCITFWREHLSWQTESRNLLCSAKWKSASWAFWKYFYFDITRAHGSLLTEESTTMKKLGPLFIVYIKTIKSILCSRYDLPSELTQILILTFCWAYQSRKHFVSYTAQYVLTGTELEAI